jgi:hypothetical protein
VLLSLVLIYVGANLKTLNTLKRELSLTEKRQVQRLALITATNAAFIAIQSPQTNAPPTNSPTITQPDNGN